MVLANTLCMQKDSKLTPMLRLTSRPASWVHLRMETIGRHENGEADFHRTGILCVFLCLALGIANIFHFNLLILFSVICLYVIQCCASEPFSALAVCLTLLRVSAFIILFIEVPLLLRICPTSTAFDAFIRRFATNYMRAAIYGVMSVIQWISISVDPSSLIAAAVLLLIAGLFYLAAGIKGQAFQGSKTLGGAGVAQMII